MSKFLSLLLILVLGFGGQAMAEGGTAFPPAGCSAETPFMSFTGDGDTYCDNGQNVLKNAVPACAANQMVVYDGSKFFCKAENANVPHCSPNEFLSFDGETYQCKSTGVATCGANQVLTFNGSSYFCVNKDANIPVCGANQFLTYNGTYQCAGVATPAPLNIGCPSGQVLTGISNNQAVCGTASTGARPCTLEVYRSSYYDQYFPYYVNFMKNLDGSYATAGTGFTPSQYNAYGYGMYITNTYNVPNGANSSYYANGVNYGGGTTGGQCVEGNWYGVSQPPPPVYGGGGDGGN